MLISPRLSTLNSVWVSPPAKRCRLPCGAEHGWVERAVDVTLTCDLNIKGVAAQNSVKGAGDRGTAHAVSPGGQLEASEQRPYPQDTDTRLI